MPLTTPRFWYQRRRGWQAWLLWPLGWLYGCAVTLHRRGTRSWRCSVPVLSIGNLTLGGTGKTPLGIALAQGLEKRGWRVAVLLRGYGSARGGSPACVCVCVVGVRVYLCVCGGRVCVRRVCVCVACVRAHVQ